MSISAAQEVNQLREENPRLKRQVAELTLDKGMLQSLIRKTALPSGDSCTSRSPQRNNYAGRVARDVLRYGRSGPELAFWDC